MRADGRPPDIAADIKMEALTSDPLAYKTPVCRLPVSLVDPPSLLAVVRSVGAQEPRIP